MSEVHLHCVMCSVPAFGVLWISCDLYLHFVFYGYMFIFPYIGGFLFYMYLVLVILPLLYCLISIFHVCGTCDSSTDWGQQFSNITFSTE